MYSFSDRHIGINNLDKTNMLDYVGSKNIEDSQFLKQYLKI